MLSRLNTVILFIYFFAAKALVLFGECATKQWQHICPHGNIGDTLQQTKCFQHGTFSSEDLADYQGSSFVVGMCQFCQTCDGHQLLAANVPGALLAYQLPVVGKLPGSPPGRQMNCQLLAWQL